MFGWCYRLSQKAWCYSIDVIIPTNDEDPKPHYYINKNGNKIIIN